MKKSFIDSWRFTFRKPGPPSCGG